MFCAQTQSKSKLSKKLKHGIKIFEVRQAVLKTVDQNIIKADDQNLILR